MTRARTETLQVLSAIRQATLRGAEARLSKARQDAQIRQRDEEDAAQAYETLSRAADTYMARQIRTIGPTRDGASIFASLALGATHRRRDAASAELQHRRAVSRNTEARGTAEDAASDYLTARQNAEALRETEKDVLRDEARRQARREEDILQDMHAGTLGTGTRG